MNEELALYARNFLKENIVKCTEGEIHVFKQMYSPTRTELPIAEVIDKMADEKLDWAMDQIKNTLKKKDETNDRRVPEAKEKI